MRVGFKVDQIQRVDRKPACRYAQSCGAVFPVHPTSGSPQSALGQERLVPFYNDAAKRILPFPRVYRFMPAVLHSPSATCRHGRRPRLSVRPTVRRDGHCAAAAQSAVCSRYVLSVLLSRAVSASACAGARCRIENGRRPQDLPGSQAILHQRCTNVPWPERDANSRLPDRKSRVGCKTLWSRVSRQSLELRGYFRRAP